MKNYVTVAFLCLSLFTCSLCLAQEELKQKNSKHEIKVDVLDFIALNSFEMSYERLNSKNSSFGISMFVNSSNTTDFQEKFALSPFFRFYFFNKKDYGSKGFFAELFTKFVSGKRYVDEFNSDEKKEYQNLNLGFSLGRKWVHTRGLAVEYSLGVGRGIVSKKHAPELTFRGGVSVGYRF